MGCFLSLIHLFVTISWYNVNNILLNLNLGLSGCLHDCEKIITTTFDARCQEWSLQGKKGFIKCIQPIFFSNLDKSVSSILSKQEARYLGTLDSKLACISSLNHIFRKIIDETSFLMLNELLFQRFSMFFSMYYSQSCTIPIITAENIFNIFKGCVITWDTPTLFFSISIHSPEEGCNSLLNI